MSTFSFGFAGDDIDQSLGESVDHESLTLTNNALDDGEECLSVPVLEHSIPELLNSLPSQISFTTTLITSPINHRQCLIPRRSLFDVKIQLAAEDQSLTDPVTTSSSALGESDITSRVYEGGFKSWEGTSDLAQLLLDNPSYADVEAVVELGTGTATPSCVLLQQALQTHRPVHLTLADYNSEVLRLVTLPNMVLSWALSAQTARESFSPAAPEVHGSRIVHGDGDLNISPALLQSFVADLAAEGINLSLLSGPWSPQLASLCNVRSSLLVLAAETIYSPRSIASFTQTLLSLLQRLDKTKGIGIIASKRVYFGVGGGVDEFVQAVSRTARATVEQMAKTKIPGCDEDLGEQGVGRSLLQVRLT